MPLIAKGKGKGKSRIRFVRWGVPVREETSAMPLIVKFIESVSVGHPLI